MKRIRATRGYVLSGFHVLKEGALYAIHENLENNKPGKVIVTGFPTLQEAERYIQDVRHPSARYHYHRTTQAHKVMQAKTGSKCDLFSCRSTYNMGRVCCRKCPMLAFCENPCINSPERCGHFCNK